MTLFKKAPIRTWDEQASITLKIASNRVAKLNDEQLCMWADTASSEMMKAFEDYMSHEEIVSLEEITECVITLQAVVMILRERYALTHADD